MPIPVAQDGNQALSHPEIGHSALLIAIFLAAIGVLLLVVTLFWINRRMKKALGLHGRRSGLERLPDHRDPWAEAGRRLDGENLDSLYMKDDEDRPG